MLPLTYAINEDTQSISELWESLANFASNRVKDNKMSSDYPLETRLLQMDALVCLIDSIKATHVKMLSDSKGE